MRNGIPPAIVAGVGRVRLACQHGVMSALRTFGRVTGWTCMAIGGIQLFGGVRWEPGIAGHATVDSHVRFMGPVFAGYGLGWLDATAAPDPDLDRMRVLAGLMAGPRGRRTARDPRHPGPTTPLPRSTARRGTRRPGRGGGVGLARAPYWLASSAGTAALLVVDQSHACMITWFGQRSVIGESAHTAAKSNVAAALPGEGHTLSTCLLATESGASRRLHEAQKDPADGRRRCRHRTVG
jgi:hypothetical protein